MTGPKARSESRRGLPAAPIDGRTLLRLSRDSSREALDRLREQGPEAIAEALQELTPARRGEVLELSEQVDEIVPLLPEAEFTATVRGAGIEEYGWLVEFATPEQRVAAVDLDCWRDFRFSPTRLLEWIDAMIAAGPATLAASFDELDPELWVLAMKAMGDFSGPGSADDNGLDGSGLFSFEPNSEEDEARIQAILGAALQFSPNHYWWLVSAAMFESAAEASLMAARWQQGRLADLGFPGREQAMKAYRPLAAEELPRPAAVIEQGADERSDQPLPAPLAGRVLGRALAGLPDSLRDHVLGDLFGVANSLAVADLLPLAEPETVERCVSKAVRGIDRGLEEAARAQGRTPAMVLQAVPVLDLFRIGATLEPELRPVRTVADLKREEEDGTDWDWNEIREMIAEADRTIGADGRLK